MTPEELKFLEQLKDMVKSGKTLNDAIMDCVKGCEDFKKVGALEAAVKQLEGDLKAMPANLETKLAQIKRQAWDPNGRYRGVFANETQARGFGLLCLGLDPNIGPKYRAMYVKEFADLEAKAQSSSQDNLGGTLIPIEFSTRIKRLVESYGVFSRYAYRIPMSSDQLVYNKMTGEVAVYITGEGSAPTDSAAGFTPVNLMAKEWNVLTYYPRTLAEDAIAPIGELIARSIAWALAKRTDQVGFIGDGTSTYLNGVKGVKTQLDDLYVANTYATGGGIVKGTGTTWASLVLADFLATLGALPQYADNAGDMGAGSDLMGVPAPQARWFCSRNFFFTVMMRVLTSIGGIRLVEAQGRYELIGPGGAPVSITQVMPTATAQGKVACLFGDVGMAATIGDRVVMTIEQSREYKFAERQVTVLARERKAISIEDVGTATVAGPIVGLATANS